MTNLTVTDVYIIGLPIIFMLMMAEATVSQYQNKKYYKNKDTLCTSGLVVGNILMSLTIKGATLALHFYLYEFRVFDISNSIPVWLLWVLTFVLIDFVFYIYHRCSHKIRFLWAIHMSHHSSEEMNFGVSLRQAWLGPVSKIPFFAILPLIGFDPTVIAVAGVISTLWGVVGHTQMVGKLGPLEWILNTPSHHRVHHGSNPEYIDKNYGNLLIIWDRLFGTFEPEKAKVTYGLVNNVNTFNPIKITLMDWQAMLREIKEKEKASEKIKIFFGAPQTKVKNLKKVINIKEKFGKFDDLWSPKIISVMNDYEFKLVKVKDDFVWHKHDETDEVFIVMEGRLFIEFEEETAELNAGEMIVVPKGVKHRPYAKDLHKNYAC